MDKMKTVEELKKYFTRLPNRIFYNVPKKRFEKIYYVDESICALYLSTEFLDNSRFYELSKYRITLDNEGIPEIELLNNCEINLFQLDLQKRSLEYLLNEGEKELIRIMNCELENPAKSFSMNYN